MNDIIYALTDIHGCYNTLKLMYKRIINDVYDHGYQKPLIVFCGDYVDRGPDSDKVVASLMNDEINLNNEQVKVRDYETVHLTGNHEEMMIDAVVKNRPHAMGMWLGNGGRQTAQSYQNYYPKPHTDWMQKLKYFHAVFPFFFVHAGVYDDRPLDKQEKQVYTWIREEFLNCPRPYHWKGNDWIIVHGHTPTPDIDQKFNHINLDTGCCFKREEPVLIIGQTKQDKAGYGMLSCAVLTPGKTDNIRFLQQESVL